MITLYGIPNCDTVKRARQRLNQAGLDFTFHDFRKDGLEPSLVAHWLATLGQDTLINRRGTTWRKLSTEEQDIASDAQATQLLVSQPSLIKRPVMDCGGQLRVGFAKKDETDILAWLQQNADTA